MNKFTIAGVDIEDFERFCYYIETNMTKEELIKWDYSRDVLFVSIILEGHVEPINPKPNKIERYTIDSNGHLVKL
jgi:hypothetical protein